MGTAPPTPKLACFVLYLKNYQNLFEKQYMHLIVNFPMNSKHSFKIKEGQAVLELLIQTASWLFDLLKNRLAY